MAPQVVGLLSYAVDPTPGHDLATEYAEAQGLIEGWHVQIIWRIDYRPGQSIPANDTDLDEFLTALSTWRSSQPEGQAVASGQRRYHCDYGQRT